VLGSGTVRSSGPASSHCSGGERASPGEAQLPADFEVSAGRFVNYRARDGVGAMVSLSIPIAYKSKYDAPSRGGGATFGRQKRLRRVEDGIRREVRQAFVRAGRRSSSNLFVSTHIRRLRWDNDFDVSGIFFLSVLG